MSEPTQEYKDQLKIIDEAEQEAGEQADISKVRSIEDFRQYLLNKQRFFFPILEKKVQNYSREFVLSDLLGNREPNYYSQFLTKIRNLGSSPKFENIKTLIDNLVKVAENLDKRSPNNNLSGKVLGFPAGFSSVSHRLEARFYRNNETFRISKNSFNPRGLIHSANSDILERNQDMPINSYIVPYTTFVELSRLGKGIASYLPFEKMTDELRKARVITKSTNSAMSYEFPINRIEFRMGSFVSLIRRELEVRNPLSFLSITNSSFPILSLRSSPGGVKRGLYFPELKTVSTSGRVYMDYLRRGTLPARLQFVSCLDHVEVFSNLDDPSWLAPFNHLYQSGSQPFVSFSLLTLFVPQTITSYRYLRYMQYKVNQSPLSHGIKILMPQDLYGYDPTEVFKPFTQDEKLDIARKSLRLSNLTGLLEPVTHVPVNVLVANQGSGVIALAYIQEILKCLENVDRLYLETYWTV